MTLIHGLYGKSILPVVEHVVRDPGSRSSPVYARSNAEDSSKAPGPDLAGHLTEMLRRGEERTTALIQTLVANRSTSGLMSALRRDPSLITASMMLTLADCNARKEFGAALQMRPDVVSAQFLLELGNRTAVPRLLQMALQTRPDLRQALSEAASRPSAE